MAAGYGCRPRLSASGVCSAQNTDQRPITRKDTKITHVSQLAGKRVGTVQGGNAGPNLLKVQPKAELVEFQ